MNAMYVRWGLLGLAAVSVILVLADAFWRENPTPVRIPYGDRAAVEAGKAIYAEACASCHGANLEGQPDWRRRLPNGRLPAPPHDDTGHTWHHPDQDLFDVTKFGVARFGPPGYESDMPAFDGVLTDSEILASLAYIKSTWPADVQRRHDALNGDG